MKKFGPTKSGYNVFTELRVLLSKEVLTKPEREKCESIIQWANLDLGSGRALEEFKADAKNLNEEKHWQKIPSQQKDRFKAIERGFRVNLTL